jgi:hypothetical protein
MMWKIVAAIFFFATEGAAVAQQNMEREVAQLLEGTIYVVPHRESADGVLKACGLEFAALTADFSTRGGLHVRLTGSFYIRSAGDGILYMLKMGVADRLGSGGKPVAPNNAFISAPNGVPPKKALRIDSDTPGFALFVGDMDAEALAAYEAIVEDNKLVVGFNRKPNQQDVTTELDLTVVKTEMIDGKAQRTRSDDAVAKFAACTADLVRRVQKK